MVVMVVMGRTDRKDKTDIETLLSRYYLCRVAFAILVIF